MRPPVSVVVPFAGGPSEAAALLEALSGLRLSSEDEVIVVDNTPAGVLARKPNGPVALVHAAEERSSYYARNVGAEQASGEWLLFVDSDCRPGPTLLDDYFREPPGKKVGAVAGPVVPMDAGQTLVARYGAARQPNMHRRDLPYRRPFAVTASLLVRAEAWRAVGGFHEGIRSAGDVDFAWRMQDLGWRVELRAAPAVPHLQRTTLRQLVRTNLRYGAGLRWLQTRHPEELQRGRIAQFARPIVRSLLEAPRHALAGDREEAIFRLVDALSAAALGAGYLRENAPARAAPTSARCDLRVAVLVERFPEPYETFVVNEVRALTRAGHAVSVESHTRPTVPRPGATRGLAVRYLEDDGLARRLAALAWLAARHPRGCLADLVARRRWAREEGVLPLRALAPAARRLAAGGRPHLHAHFARGAALTAMRLSALLGLPYSVTAHAWDVYKAPANLREKLARAAFSVGTCDYVVADLRELAPEAASRVHKVVMGVDGDEFRRERPYPANGWIQAVGRLVEKKGFGYLIEAAAALEARGEPSQVVIVGDGELRSRLESDAERLGARVRFAGAKGPEDVRAMLEEASVLAMPCVVAADGDRDSMPVVVKEALAKEVPVVASDEVGLPEVVRPEWGRLVPPRDAAALAEALHELLDLPVEEREAMGRAGREFVLREFTIERQTARLAELIAAVR